MGIFFFLKYTHYEFFNVQCAASWLLLPSLCADVGKLIKIQLHWKGISSPVNQIFWLMKERQQQF